MLAAKNSFPLHMAGPVYLNSFNYRESWRSYFIDSTAGNWLVDSPRFTTQLVKKFQAMGGISYIFSPIPMM
jgi:hypothetical protein